MSSKYNVRLFTALLLALVTALVLVVGSALSQSGFGDSSAEAKGHEKTSGETTAPPAKNSDAADIDVACIPQNGKDLLQQDGTTVPSLDDIVPAVPEALEGDPSSNDQPEGDVTYRDALEQSLSNSELSSDKKDQVKKQEDKADRQGEIPTCATKPLSTTDNLQMGDIKIVAPGDPEDGKIIKGDESSDPKDTTTGLLGVVDRALMPEAQAQSTSSCTTRFSLVKQTTVAPRNDVISVASAINQQMIHDYSPKWSAQCAWISEIVDGNLGGTPSYGNWPIYLTNTEPSPYTGVQHRWGPWPFRPSFIGAFAYIPDVFYSPTDPASVPAWTVAISHEAMEMASRITAGANSQYNTTASGSYVGQSGTVDYQWEIGDMVAPVSYGYSKCSVNYDGRCWPVSDFVFYNWFQPGSTGPWDWTGNVPGPLSMNWDANPPTNAIRFYAPYYSLCNDPPSPGGTGPNQCKWPDT